MSYITKVQYKRALVADGMQRVQKITAFSMPICDKRCSCLSLEVTIYWIELILYSLKYKMISK